MLFVRDKIRYERKVTDILKMCSNICRWIVIFLLKFQKRVLEIERGSAIDRVVSQTFAEHHHHRIIILYLYQAHNKIYKVSHNYNIAKFRLYIR